MAKRITKIAKKVKEKNYWKRLRSVRHWFKSFTFAVAIGLSYYLGNMFFSGYWLKGLILSTIIIAILMPGNLLDVLIPEPK